MALNLNDWNIQSRARQCAVTGRPFNEGDPVHSALYWKDGAYLRIDMSEEAWNQRNDNIAPISSWKFAYEPPPPPPPEPLKKDDAESLLRRMMEENEPSKLNARYILALMLERKRILKMLDRKKNGADTILIYEHTPTGETWLIQDPHLKLAELEPVQNEVAALLHTTGPVHEPTPAPVQEDPTFDSAQSAASEQSSTESEAPDSSSEESSAEAPAESSEPTASAEPGETESAPESENQQNP
jgi:hypothetical protein